MTTLHDLNAAPRLLLHNIFNYGHFLVYASVFTRWALSKGFEVHMLGRGLDQTPYARRFGGLPGVVLHDARLGERLAPGQANWVRRDLLVEGLRSVLQAQRELKPQATVLLTTDDCIFENVGLSEPGFRFETPTCGLLTFGNQEYYSAYRGAYSAKAAALAGNGSPFEAVFTLDEHHAQDSGADPDHLVFLPDIFAEDVPASPPSCPATQAGRDLLAFLNAGTGPVFPVIGKFDQRKNNIMVLELAASMPDASCVVLGERVPCQEDGRVDALLETLRREGALFESWGFVPEELFHIALAHDRTALLPLPYTCHYGSSGIQLLGFAHGKPSVVPSNGLMARRVAGHGLGRVFHPGDKAGFEGACWEILESGASAYRNSCLEFMTFFNESSRGTQIGRAFGMESGRPVELALNARRVERLPGLERIHRASAFFLSSKEDESLQILDELLAANPGDPLALFRKAMILLASEQREEASGALLALAARGTLEEFDFFVRQAARDCSEHLGARDEALAIRRVLDLLTLLPASTADKAGRPALSPAAWQQAGVFLARAGAREEAADCFRQALRLDPGWHDCRLNLSDVLRYAGRYAQSLAELDELETAAPGWPGINHKRGQVLFEMGEMEKALEHFSLEPEDSPHRRAAMEYVERARRTCPPAAKRLDRGQTCMKEPAR